MPTYDYRCKHCGHVFEAFQGINDAPLRRCPKCHKNGVERLISAGAGVIFKGSGFYQTDYKHGSSRPNKGASNGGSSSQKKDSAGGKQDGAAD